MSFTDKTHQIYPHFFFIHIIVPIWERKALKQKHITIYEGFTEESVQPASFSVAFTREMKELILF